MRDPVLRTALARLPGQFLLAAAVGFGVLTLDIVPWRIAAITSVAALVGIFVRDAVEARARICPVHGERVGLRQVPVAYGPFSDPPGGRLARTKHFPFGGEPPRSRRATSRRPRMATLKVCARCEEARASWLQSHPRP